MRIIIILLLVAFQIALNGQIVYTVNNSNDSDDGKCDSIDCTLREAMLAANQDGKSSRIEFNIPDSISKIIIPSGPLPNITDSFLQIVGESQPGPERPIEISFGYRNFGGIEYLKIIATNVKISGITFSDFGHSLAGDKIIQIGDHHISADHVSIYNNKFTNDNFTLPLKTYFNISVFNGNNVVIQKNVFGSDYMKSVIHTFFSSLHIDTLQGLKVCHIDSNIFVTSNTAIVAEAGDLLISNNIFGGLDTTKLHTFTNQQIGLDLGPSGSFRIYNNFFIFHAQAAIRTKSLQNKLSVSNNRFYNFATAIQLTEKSNADILVDSNYAKNPKYTYAGIFIENTSEGRLALSINNNEVHFLQNFMISNLTSAIQYIRHRNNRIFCNEFSPIMYTGDLSVKPPSPIIQNIGINYMNGICKPLQRVDIYYNSIATCPTASCKGGSIFARVQSDSLGNWAYNGIFPLRVHYSAFSYHTPPLGTPDIYSEFSHCANIVDTENAHFNRDVSFFVWDNILYVNISNVKVNYKEWEWEIFDNAGKFVEKLDINSLNTTVYLGAMPAGIYYLRLREKHLNILTKKIILQ